MKTLLKLQFKNTFKRPTLYLVMLFLPLVIMLIFQFLPGSLFLTGIYFSVITIGGILVVGLPLFELKQSLLMKRIHTVGITTKKLYLATFITFILVSWILVFWTSRCLLIMYTLNLFPDSISLSFTRIVFVEVNNSIYLILSSKLDVYLNQLEIFIQMHTYSEFMNAFNNKIDSWLMLLGVDNFFYPKLENFQTFVNNNLTWTIYQLIPTFLNAFHLKFGSYYDFFYMKYENNNYMSPIIFINPAIIENYGGVDNAHSYGRSITKVVLFAPFYPLYNQFSPADQVTMPYLIENSWFNISHQKVASESIYFPNVKINYQAQWIFHFFLFLFELLVFSIVMFIIAISNTTKTYFQISFIFFFLILIFSGAILPVEVIYGSYISYAIGSLIPSSSLSFEANNVARAMPMNAYGWNSHSSNLIIAFIEIFIFFIFGYKWFYFDNQKLDQKYYIDKNLRTGLLINLISYFIILLVTILIFIMLQWKISQDMYNMSLGNSGADNLQGSEWLQGTEAHPLSVYSPYLIVIFYVYGFAFLINIFLYLGKSNTARNYLGLIMIINCCLLLFIGTISSIFLLNGKTLDKH